MADEDMKKEFDWMYEYPAYVELYDAESLDTPQKNGISCLMYWRMSVLEHIRRQ
jgi:hypothetical protein